jgi:hypothetical protein
VIRAGARVRPIGFAGIACAALAACNHSAAPKPSGLLTIVVDVPLPGGSTR